MKNYFSQMRGKVCNPLPNKVNDLFSSPRVMNTFNPTDTKKGAALMLCVTFENDVSANQWKNKPMIGFVPHRFVATAKPYGTVFESRRRFVPHRFVATAKLRIAGIHSRKVLYPIGLWPLQNYESQESIPVKFCTPSVCGHCKTLVASFLKTYF